MEGHIDFLEDLTVERRQWRVQICVVRVWKQPSFTKDSCFGDCLEMVVVDQRGTRFQATINGVHVNKFRPRIREMGNYIIEGFLVVANRQRQFKPCDSKLRIVFQYKTIVTHSEPPVIPSYGLNFIDYGSITQASKNNEFLIDVVGVMTYFSGLREFSKGNNNYRNVNLHLENLFGSKINCVLWGDFADQLLNYIQSNKDGPYIVVLQFAKTGDKFGDLEISNSKYATRLLINPVTSELDHFRARLQETEHSNSQSFSQLSTQKANSIEDDFLNDNPQKTLDDLRDYRVPGKCIIHATAKAFAPRSKWWYNGCASGKCAKSVSYDGDAWYCTRCSTHWPDPIPMYKLELNVMDNTNKSTFIVFGVEAEKIVNASATSVIDSILERGGDAAEHPVELQHLINSSYLFKVQINKENIADPEETNFHVHKICNDQNIIKSFLSKYQIKEAIEIDLPTPTVTCLSDCTSASSKTIEVDLPTPTGDCNSSWTSASSKASVTTIEVGDSVEVITPSKASMVSTSKTQPNTGHSVTRLSKRIKQEK